MSARLDELMERRSTKYYHENRKYFKMFFDYIGNIPVSEVTKDQINKFILEFARSLRKTGKTNYGANACLRLLKTLFNFGITILEIEMQNPCQGIKPLTVGIKSK